MSMEVELEDDDFALIENDGVNNIFTVHHGWLQKQSEREFLATWQNRFFCLLSDGKLQYYTQEYEELRGTIDLWEITELKWMRESDDSNTFLFSLVSPTRTYNLYSERLEDLTLWVKSIAAVRRGEIRSPLDVHRITAGQFRPKYEFAPGKPPSSPRDPLLPLNSSKSVSQLATVTNTAPPPIPERLNVNVYKCDRPAERSSGSFAQRNMQTTCFLRWVKSRISKIAPHVALTDLKQIADGHVLVYLAQSLTGSAPDGVVSSPSNAREVLENCSKSVRAIAERLKLNLPSVPIPLVMSGNVKAQLDLIWSIIYAIEIEPLNYSALKDRFALLKWLQERTSVYQGVDITDFTTGFGNGMALLALVHSQKPSLFDYGSLADYKAMDNLRQALSLNEEHFGVPKLFDPADLATEEAPDEAAMIVYFAACYRAYERR